MRPLSLLGALAAALLAPIWVACGSRTELDVPPPTTGSAIDAAADVATTRDAAEIDASTIDASTTDTYVADAGAPDTSVADTAPPSIDAAGDGCTLGCTPNPAAPRQLAPLSTANVTSHRPTLRWVLAPGSDGASVDICRDRACANILETFLTPGASGAPSSALSPGVYFWRVRGTASGAVGTGVSAVWEFFVTAKNAPVDTSWTTSLDVDGDGFADTVASRRNGSVDIFLGSANGPSNTAITIAAPGTTLSEEAVSTAGDVNGDGYGDFIVAWGGGANLFLGGPSFATTPPTFIQDGNVADYQIVCSLAGVGDVNGDGYGDVVLTDPNCRNGSQTSEAIHLHYGGPNGISPTPTLIPYDEWGFGDSVSAAGDVNGDGYADIVTQANPGLFVFLGGPNGPGAPIISTTAYYGDCRVTGAMDVNGDGYADVAIGEPGGDAWTPGLIEVHLGGPGGVSTTPSTTLMGPGTSAEGNGNYLANAGDTNGDGYDDMIVSGYLWSGYTGPTYLFYGNANGIGPSPVEFTYYATTRYLSGGGDVNGDGYSDFVMTEVGTDIQVVYGDAAGLPDGGTGWSGGWGMQILDVMGAAL